MRLIYDHKIENISQIESAIIKKYYYILKNLHPILKQVKIVKAIHHETTLYDINNQKRFEDLKRIESKVVYSVDDILNYDIDNMSYYFYDIIKQQLDSTARELFETISNVSEMAGNVINTNEKFTFDSVLKMLEMIEVKFDKEGNAELPSAYLDPASFDEFRKMKPTEEQNKKFDEILATKKEKFYAAKRYRKLSYID